jgi:hypothetical protein
LGRGWPISAKSILVITDYLTDRNRVIAKATNITIFRFHRNQYFRLAAFPGADGPADVIISERHISGEFRLSVTVLKVSYLI